MKKLVAVLVVVLIIVGIFFKDKLSSGNEYKNEIDLTIAGKIKSFDPALAFDDDSLTVMGQALDTLYQYHYLKRPYEIIPSLADGMPQISNDGKVYTIKIKNDIRYQNHKAFEGVRFVKAQDFINSIKRLAFKPIKSVGSWLFEGKLLGFDDFSRIVGEDVEKMLSTPITGLKAIDELTLQITLTRPEPNLLYSLAMYFTAPVPEELIRHTENDLSTTLVGTGAYQLTEVTNKYYRFEKFPHFRNEQYPSSGDRYANTQDLLQSKSQKLPFVDSVNFHIIQDEQVRWEKFLNKEIDIVSVPKKFLDNVLTQNSELYQKLKKEGVEVKHFSKLASRWLGFNMQDPVVGKGKNALYLRKAIAHAIDYEKYIEVLTNNTNLKANSIFNPSIPGYSPSHKNPYQYDVKLAKDFLRKAGYPNGVGLPPITYTTRGTQQINLDEAQFFKTQLEKIGIKMEIEVIEFSEFIKRGRSASLKQIWTDNWIYDYPDAENVIQLLISKNYPGINKSGFVNTKVDGLYNELSKTLEPKKRFDIMYKVEEIVYGQLPWIMMMYESSYILQRNNLKNYRKSYFIKNHIKYLKKVR
jgi:oligopeptide transport system substrate-binding protein